MAKYKIEIKELLCKIVDIEANSEFEAISKVKKLYADEKIVLTANEYCDTEITLYQDKYLSTDKKILINEVIDYLLEQEKKHYEEFDDKHQNHIYLKLLKLKELNQFV